MQATLRPPWKQPRAPRASSSSWRPSPAATSFTAAYSSFIATRPPSSARRRRQCDFGVRNYGARRIEDLYVTASYVGSKGTRLISRIAPLNVLDPALLDTYGEQLYAEFQPGDPSLHGVPLPYEGWVEQMTACTPSVAQALLPYPQYCGRLQGVNENAGNSTYHSLHPRVTNLRGFGYKNQDLTIAKHFRISERVTFQLRGDFFNIFNLHTFRGYANGFDTDVASPSFGHWNGEVSGPRSVQVGGRIDF